MLSITKLPVYFSGLRNDMRVKGFRRGAINYFQEAYYKRLFRKIAIDFPDLSDNIEETQRLSVNKDSRQGQCSSFHLLLRAFRQIPLLRPDISLLDYGCGCGKTMVVGMKLGFRQVTGVDLDKEALSIAQSNCEKMRRHSGKTAFQLFSYDATLYPIPSGVNTIYFFNPFGASTMSQVLDNIQAYVQKIAHPVYVIYMNPLHESLMMDRPGFTRIFLDTFKNGKIHACSIFKVKAVEKML